MRYEQVCNKKAEDFRRLTGIKKETFVEMLLVLKEAEILKMKKGGRPHKLSLEEKLASDRVLNENVIGKLKRFKIISDRYRNRRKRFGLRFNLITGIYNFELNK